METGISKSKYISKLGVNDKAGKTQETPCSLSSVINMWLRFGCQVKFPHNYILSDLLKSKSKFALKVNTANFPYSAGPWVHFLVPLLTQVVSEISGCSLMALPPLQDGSPAQVSPQEYWGGESAVLSGAWMLQRGTLDWRWRCECKAPMQAVAACPLSLIVRKGVTHLSHRQ